MPDSKKCRKCGVEKSLDSFHKHRLGRLGLRPHCKQCRAELAKLPREVALARVRSRKYASNQANYEKIISRALARRSTADGCAKYKEEKRRYRQGERGKTAARADREKAKLSGRTSARSAVAQAIAKGLLPKATDLKCCRCGVRAEEYHHHLGYDEQHRLSVVPICRKCHAKEEGVTNGQKET